MYRLTVTARGYCRKATTSAYYLTEVEANEDAQEWLRLARAAADDPSVLTSDEDVLYALDTETLSTIRVEVRLPAR